MIFSRRHSTRKRNSIISDNNTDAEVTKTILVDKMRIPMGDIVKVEAPGKIFETRWEDQSVSWDT